MNSSNIDNLKSYNKIALFLISIFFVIGLTGCGCQGGKKEEKEIDRSATNAFFIKNEDNKYALFNEDGKKLTDFEFTNVGDFLGGTTIVRKDDQYGVINDSGKMVINFGEYKSISQSAGLFKATDEDRNEYLLSRSNKKIADLKDASVKTFIGVNEYSILKDEKKYYLLDFDGKKVLEFDKVEKEEDSPSTSHLKNFVSVYYEGKVYVVNLKNGKEVTNFDSKGNFCINTVEKDGKIIILNSCGGIFGSAGDDYRVIKDNKYYDLSDKCEKIGYSDEELICISGSERKILNDKMELGLDINSAEYKQKDGYAKDSNNDVIFYDKNGSEITTVKCRDLDSNGKKTEGLYILNTHFNKTCGTDFGTYEYYNEKGEKMFDKTFSSAKAFDSNKLAQVSEEKGKVYLIDLKGKKVSEDYSQIMKSDDFYTVTSDSKKGILGKDGKEIVVGEYKNVTINKTSKDFLATLETEDGKYVVYNLSSKKEVMNSSDKVNVQKHYITVTVNGKVEYYTFAGKKFY